MSQTQINLALAEYRSLSSTPEGRLRIYLRAMRKKSPRMKPQRGERAPLYYLLDLLEILLDGHSKSTDPLSEEAIRQADERVIAHLLDHQTYAMTKRFVASHNALRRRGGL